MKQNLITCLLLVLNAHTISAQQILTNLNGFYLGQYRDTPKNEFGNPVQKDKYDDGYEYEAFIAKPDSSMYMVFEYAAGHPDEIWSIQVSGNNLKADIGFKGLKLGLDKSEVERVLGKPDKKEAIGEYGETWLYEGANYSLEISKKGKLSSVKITDTYSANPPEVNELPKFDSIVKFLNSKKNADIACILAPGVEIYYKGKTLSYGKSVRTEIETDYSKLFQTIRALVPSLNKINTSDQNVYEEKIRIAMGQNSKHEIKIKSGHVIKEIVLDNVNGKYLIWEINAE